MTVTLDIPEELAVRLGDRAEGLTREALAVAAVKAGLWSEGELGRFLGMSRFRVWQFLRDQGVDSQYSWEDLQSEREIFRKAAHP